MRSLERKPIYFEDLISRVKMFFIVGTVAIVCLFLAVAMRRPDDEKWKRPLWKRPYPAEKDQNDISVKSVTVGTEITGLDKTTSNGHKHFNNQNDIAVKISKVVSETSVVDTTKSSVQSYRPDISPKSAGETMPVKPLTQKTDPNTIKEKELQKREQFIHDYCKANHHIQLTTEDGMKFVYSEKYNLYATPIQKIGSTFLKLMFYILKNGASEANKEFNRSRTKVQTDSDMRASKLTPAQLNNSTIIAPVRNPYSRLFAAYVDKIYLPNTRSLIQAVVRYHHEHDNTLQKSKPFLENILGQSKYSNTSYEEHMVSFQDFLSYALFSNGTVVLQNHFDPCFPRLQKLICNRNNYIVVKEESFADDIKYALRKVNLDKRDADSYDVILKSLEQSRAEITIPGIIKTALSKFSEENKVWNRQILVERLWHSFQIQGYIDKKSHFPYELFSSNFEITDSYVIRVILKEIETHPLSPTDRKKQRAEAMLAAFRQVDDTLLEKIQKAYSDDFSAFKYSKAL